MPRILPILVLVCFLPRPVWAQVFAVPPGEEAAPIDDRGGAYTPVGPVPDERSTVRVSVGPALRLSEQSPAGGLAAAVDIGASAAGARFSGAWVRVGSDRGAAEYRGELFIDFGSDERLHPILGAGAGVARLDGVDDAGEIDSWTYGVGVVRGTLEYELPVPKADARAGLDLVGSVPAIYAKGAPEQKPWLLFVARVGVGF